MSMFVSGRVLLWLLILSVIMAAAGAGQVTSAPRIESVAYDGDGSVSTGGNEFILWEAAAHRFSVSIAGGSHPMDGTLCLETAMNSTESHRELTCQSVALAANRSATVAVSVDRWPANLTGPQSVRAVLHSPEGNTVSSSSALSLSVVRRDGDLDGDSLSNQREVSLGTALRDGDSDGDGIPDGMEVRTYDTSPVNTDTDGDSLPDGAEVDRHGTDPTASDPDGDGLPDARELAVGTDPGTADTDGDGVSDAAEVNTYGTDPSVADTDGDGLDDGAEVNTHETNPVGPDTDGDGLTDTLEVNTYDTDPNNVDSDGDGLQDGTEVNRHSTDPATADMDGDGLTDGQEINTFGTNPADPDTDSDRLNDGVEVNRHETNPTAADTDGDGLSDRVEVGERSLIRRPPPAVVALGLTLVALAGVGVRYWSGRVRGVFQRVQSDADESADPPAPSTGESVSTGDDAASSDGSVPAEFLQNDDRILELVDRNGGRIPQAELVEATGWSKSKVSRVLSSMEDAGTIVKVDVGRGNIVTRPEDLPAGARSPFDE